MKYLDIYLNQLGGPLRLKLWVFTVIGFYFGAKALWRVDHIDLPFHYVLFVIPGVMLSMWMNSVEKTELTRINHRVAQRLNPLAVGLILIWILMLKFWLPGIAAFFLEYPNEALELITGAFFLGRVAITWRRIEQFLGSENKRHSLHLVSQQ